MRGGATTLDDLDTLHFATNEMAELRRCLQDLAQPSFLGDLRQVAQVLTACLQGGGKVLFCGNGGSAADAQHLAAELVGRQNYDRPAAAALALTVDTSVLTAISNDYGYEAVFARQVKALGSRGDVLVAISTSGKSKNVVNGITAAKEEGLVTISLTGLHPHDMQIADYLLAMPATTTARVQELQLVTGHLLCAIIERALFPQ